VWSVAVAATCLASATMVHGYTYNMGPNTVNVSGVRCRAATSSLGDGLTHDVGRVKVNSGISTRRLFCPIQRRNTTYYGDMVGSNIDARVGADYIYIKAQDQNTTRSLSCFPFASPLGTGAVFFRDTRYLCATADGCASVATSWTGSNLLRLSNPFAGAPLTVTWGFACDVPGSSTIYNSDTPITANNHSF
jgi:hypothetical protein